MTVRSMLTRMLVGVHSPCCMQCACESGTEGCQCFFPASPEVARDPRAFPGALLWYSKGFVPSAYSSESLGQWTKQSRDSILDSGAVWPETSPHPSLGCLSSWGMDGGWGWIESHLLGGETARYQSNVYSFYKTLISLFGMFNWTWIWSFLLLSNTILDFGQHAGLQARLSEGQH